MRRFILIFVILAALLGSLLPSAALADLEGTRLQARDNRRCLSLGRAAERNGVTERELKRLVKYHCKKSGAIWVSDLYYSA